MAIPGIQVPDYLVTSGDGDLSPTARDLVSQTDTWQELRHKCAKMERASMRICSIDLNVTGGDVQYSFDIDDGSDDHSKPFQILRDTEERVKRGAAPRPDTASEPLDRILSSSAHNPTVGEDGTGGNDPSSLSKSKSLPGVKRPVETIGSTNLNAADPNILRYFSLVEDIAEEEGDGKLSFSRPLSREGSANDITGSLRGPRTPIHQQMGDRSWPPHGSPAHPGLVASRSILNRSPFAHNSIPRPQSPLVFASTADGEGSNHSSNSNSSPAGSGSGSFKEGRCSPLLSSLSDSAGPESPKWRKPQVSRLSGSCNELRPSSSLDVSKSGKKLLKTLFKMQLG